MVSNYQQAITRQAHHSTCIARNNDVAQSLAVVRCGPQLLRTVSYSGLFTDTSEVLSLSISVFYFLYFFSFPLFSFWLRAVD